MGRPTLYVVARADYDEYQKDITRIKALTKAAGKDVSDALNNAISPKQVNNGLLSLATSLKQVSRASREFNPKGVVSGLEEIAQRSGVSIKTMDSLSQAMLKTARDNSLERAFANIQKQAGLSNLEMAKLRMQFGDTAGAFKAFGAAVAPVAATIAAATASFGFMGKAALDATLEMDRLKKAYTSIMGSDKASTTQLDYIYGVTQKLGLQFQSTAEAAKGFFASSVGTPLEKDMKSIFEGVVSAGAALALSKDQISGVFIALSQIASKGKLSMEEVHQIAERFPGTFEIIAKALKVPRDELFKLIETGTVTSGMLSDLGNAWKEKYGDAAIEASKGVQGALNKLSTEWELYKASLMDSDTAVAGINAVRGALEGIKDAGEFIGDNSAGIASLGVFAAAVGAVTVARKLDIVESGKQALADAQLHGVLNTLQDRLGGVNFVEQQRIATEKALQSESVKTAQRNIEEAQAVQAAALSAEKAAQKKLAQAVAAKENAVTWRQVQAAMAKEAAAVSALGDAQVKTYAATNALNAAQKALAVSTETTTAAFLKGSAVEKAMSGLKGAASGLVSFLGGPWGVAFTAATAGVAYLSMRQTEAEKAAQLHSNALKTLNGLTETAAEKAKKLADDLGEVAEARRNIAIDEATASIKKFAGEIKLIDFSSATAFTPQFREQAQALDDMADAVYNGEQSFSDFQQELAGFYNELRKNGEASSDLGKRIKKALDLASQGADAQAVLDALQGKTNAVADAMDDVAGAANRAGAAISAAFDPKKLEGVLQSLDIKKLFAGFDGLKLAQAQALQQAGKSAAEISKILSGEIESLETNQILWGAASAYRAEQSKKAREEAVRTAAQFAKNAEAEAKRFAESVSQYGSGLKKLRNEITAMEDALDPSLTKFERLRKQIEAEKKAAIENADVKAKETVRRKQATVAQAQETAALEKRKATLTATQKLDELENQNLKEKADFYKDLAEKTGRYSTSMEYQNQLLEKQREIWLGMGIPVNDVQEMISQLQLESSRDPFDGITRGLQGFISKATDGAKAMEDTFSGLFSGMDSGFHGVWEQMLEDGKVSLSSFRSLFASFLADLMHMAITRPITVQIAGVVSGMLGTGGVAYAAGGNGGSGGIGLGNLPFSSLLPDSWTSGVSSFLSYELPGTAPGISGLYGPTMGGGNLASGLSLGSALMYGGLGSLGYSLLGGALGLPQNKYSGITSGLGAGLGAWGASAALSGTALGATFGSAVPVVGTVIGAALGGLASSLFGGGRRTHASVYGKMEDVGFSRDQQTYIDAFMGGAWYDRAGKKEAEPFAQGIAQVASQTAGSLLDIAGALPEQIRQQALSGLKTSTWSAGRGVSGASWNFQWWKEGMGKERLEEAAKDMRNQMTAVAQKVFADAGISQFFDTFDVTTDEGLQKASTALSAISAVKSATDAIKSPLSEMEQQAQSAKAQLDAWTQGMKDSGVNAQYAAGLINEYRNAFINDYIKTLDESLHPLSAYAQAVKAANEAVDQRKKALEIIGATEGQLAQVEAMRAEVVKQATEEMLRSFGQSVAQRWAAVNGNSDEVGRAISQANELRETIQQFGEGSAQVAELLKLHAAETAKAAQDAAKSEYDSLKAQMDALEQQRVQLQQQAIQEQINAINEQINTAKTLKSTWEGLDKSLGQSRYNLFAGSANLDAENRLGTVQAEFRRLSGLALGGDSDAAGQLAGVGTSLLDIVKQTAGTEEEYLDAFFAVNAQLKSAQDAAGAQVSAADKQLEALQGQLDVQNAALKQLQGQSATLEEIEKQIADLKPLLDAAGQKAGVKAFARGGLAMPGWAVVGEEGPELVNFSQPGRVYTAADTAALFRSVTPRAADTDSGSDAEVKALRREVYQLRRDMLISMSEIARFSRRTSDMVEAWDAEGMPGVRA